MFLRGLAVFLWMGAAAALALTILNVPARPWMALAFVSCVWLLTDLGGQAWRQGGRPQKR